MSISSKYDVIIIGAGSGGLMAACRCAKLGLKTLVIEKNNAPGGCAASIRRGRFEFEPALRIIPGFGEQSAFSELGETFREFGITPEMIRLEDAYRLISTVPGGNGIKTDVTVPNGRESFIEFMEKQCPGASSAINRFFDTAKIFREGISLFAKNLGAPDIDAMRAEHPLFTKLCGSSALEIFKAIDIPDRCIDLLSAFCIYNGTDINSIDAVRYFLMLESSIVGGTFIPKLRANDIFLSLEQRAFELGCDFLYSTSVRSIKTSRGRICGITDENGKSYTCEAVISNAFPNTVYDRLIEDKTVIPEHELKKAYVRSFGGHAFTMLMGLDKSPEQLGIKDYLTIITDNDNIRGCCKSTYFRSSSSCLSASCLNIANPDASEAGTSNFSLTVMFSEGAWSDITAVNHKKIANDYSDALLDRYEKVTGIRLRDSIEELEILTPVSFAHITGAPQGAVEGYCPEFWDGIVSRAFSAKNEATIPGLFFAGSHGHRLSGFYPAFTSGDVAAKHTLAYIGGKRR